MESGRLQLALRELQATFTSARALAAMAAVALVLGLSGPFGTFAGMETPRRLIYWLVVVVLTFAVGRPVASLVAALLAPKLTRRWLRVLVASVVSGVPVTLVVLAVNEITFGDAGLPPALLWLYCTLISVAVFGMVAMLEPPARLAADAPPWIPAAPPAPSPPPILTRLPLPQRGQLLALSVKDHYVEVVTVHGRSLVLMRLSDAIGETGAVPGLQIHRSHWVALAAVRRVVRSQGRVFVELGSGERLPVSRGYLPAAREAGLLVG